MDLFIFSLKRCNTFNNNGNTKRIYISSRNCLLPWSILLAALLNGERNFWKVWRIQNELPIIVYTFWKELPHIHISPSVTSSLPYVITTMVKKGDKRSVVSLLIWIGQFTKYEYIVISGIYIQDNWVETLDRNWKKFRSLWDSWTNVAQSYKCDFTLWQIQRHMGYKCNNWDIILSLTKLDIIFSF